MQNLPIVPTQVKIRENVCSVDVFKAAHLFTILFVGVG